MFCVHDEVTHYKLCMTIMPIPLTIKFGNSRGLYLFLSWLNLAIQEHCTHSFHYWIWCATHRHHLANLCFLQQRISDIIHISQQAEKDFIQSLNEKGDTCSSSFRVTIKFYLTIFHLPIFLQKLPQVKFPLSTILKISILPIIATSEISPINLSQIPIQ